MGLKLAEVLGMKVNIDRTDPVFQRVSNEGMITYLTKREFELKVTHDSGIAVYEHPTVKDGVQDQELPFDVAIDTDDDRSDALMHAARVQDFMYSVQRFHGLKKESVPTQLQILNELV